jgi:type IV secretory pathway TraG/TraD family ATPase VirD4
MSVNEIRTMRNNEAILLFSNKKPVLLFMRPYFKHYEFKKLSEIVEVEYDKKTRNERVVYLDLKLLEK